MGTLRNDAGFKEQFVPERKKILIVEDEAYSVITLEYLFKEWGYEVCKSVASGEDAVIIAAQEMPDIVLMDIHLSGDMNGIEAAKQINGSSKPAFIFFTGYTDKELKNETVNFNTIAFIQKPVNFDQLRGIIDSYFA